MDICLFPVWSCWQNIAESVFCPWYKFSFLLGVYSGKELPGHCVFMFRYSKYRQRVCQHGCIYFIGNVWGGSSCHTLKNLVLSVLLILAIPGKDGDNDELFLTWKGKIVFQSSVL